MRRVLKFGLAVLILAGALGCLAALGWLAGTTRGACRLMEEISLRSTVDVSAATVEGSLLGGLHLEKLRLRFDEQDISAAGVTLRWRPVSLLFGKVSVREIEIRGMEIRDNRPKIPKPFDLSWPRVTGLPAWLVVQVGVLRAEGVSYRRLNDPPAMIDRLSARVGWRDGTLTVEKLALEMPSVSVGGDIMAGFRRPSLLSKLRCTPRQPLAGADSFLVTTRLSATGESGQMAGPVKITTLSGSREILQLKGGVGLLGNSVALKKMELRHHGRRGSVRCDGTLGFTKTGEPVFNLQLGLSDVDLYPELRAPVFLGGIVSLKGSPDAYRGRFAVSSKGKGWYRATLSGVFSGDSGSIGFTGLEGSLLDGRAGGSARIDWSRGILASGKISVTNINPAKINPAWRAVVNADMGGEAQWSDGKLVRAGIKGKFRNSRFLNRSLTGEADLRFAGGNLLIDRLFVSGKGFDARANGDLDRKLLFSLQVHDLRTLLPEMAGRASAEGWLRRHKGRMSGSVEGSAGKLSVHGLTVSSARIAMALADSKGYPVHGKAEMQGLVYESARLDSARLKVSGSLERHTLEATLHSTGFGVQAALSGTYDKGRWKGQLASLSGHDAVGPWKLRDPVFIALDGNAVAFSQMFVEGIEGEQLNMEGQFTFRPLLGKVKAKWERLGFARFRRLMHPLRVTGTSSGEIMLGLLPDSRVFLNGKIDLSGTVVTESHSVSLEKAVLQLDWSDRGMVNLLNAQMGGGGEFSLRFHSPLPARKVLPSEGDIEGEWKGFDVGLFQPWLPQGMDLKGVISGTMRGRLLPGNRFDVKGASSLSGGRVRMLKNGREFAADIRRADLSWNWAGDGVAGEFAALLGDYGDIDAAFRLPLAARFPVAVDEQAPMSVELTGKVRETGLLTSFFPGLVQETQGELAIAARLAGKWREPVVAGNVNLSKAGAYLPTAGIHLKDVRMSASFDRDRISITSLGIGSGAGRIEGNAVVRLEGWRVKGYEGFVKGERFQAVYLPDLQLLASPDLSFSGTLETLSVRGNIAVPELLIFGQTSRAAVQPSSDVIIRGETKPAAKKFPLALDIQIGVVLGERVLVKAEGIDAQLQGKLNLFIRKPDEIRSTGEIRVVKGKYKTYGINLDITKGRIYYAGGPISQPTLDIQALRKVGDVKAGVAIIGTPATMVVKLYSDPPLPESVIMSYIVLGQPLAYTREQSGLVEEASGKLLPAYSGHKAVSVGASGVATSRTKAGTLSESMITIGRYLTPDMYISYGRSLLDKSNLVRLRYEISRRWEVETQAGTESGGDIYFKIRFR